MSSTKPSTSESPLKPSRPRMGAWFSSDPTMVKVTVEVALQKLAGKRKRLVKDRRNLMAKAAKIATGNIMKDVLKDQADDTLGWIRTVDHQIGLLQVAPKTTKLSFDLMGEQLGDIGFGMDENGNYPAI